MNRDDSAVKETRTKTACNLLMKIPKFSKLKETESWNMHLKGTGQEGGIRVGGGRVGGGRVGGRLEGGGRKGGSFLKGWTRGRRSRGRRSIP